MRKWLAPVLLVCLIGAVLLVFFHRPAPQENAPPTAVSTNSNPEAASAPVDNRGGPPPQAMPAIAQPVLPTSYVAPTQAAAPTVPPLAPDLVDIAPKTALENMRTTFHQYASVFGGNPVGTNQEITRALSGDNPKHMVFIKADGNRVNSNGELVDLWGTPYFFHQLSGKVMEIRSAGPDHVMWTGDDLVIQ